MAREMVLQPWGCLLILHLGSQATASAGHRGSSMPSKHPRAETLGARCAGCASAAHHALPDHEPARVLHGSHSSLQLQPYNANRQVLASISEAFIIGPSWLVVTRLVVEQLPSNAVRHPLVA